MSDKKDAKLGDSFYDIKKNEWYYFDGLNWVLPLIFTYRNWSNKTSERTGIPISVYFGISEYHKTPCYMMHCFDLDKKQYRDFKLTDIITFI